MQEKKIRNKEEIKALQTELKNLNLYEGEIDSVYGSKTKEGESIKNQLLEQGMSFDDIEIYGHRKNTGLPAELMLTGEYDMWDKYGDNYKQQMSKEEYESLYNEERPNPLDKVKEMGVNFKERIKDIDLMDKLFNYMNEQK